MIHLSQNFVASVAILFAALAANYNVAVAQEHFIGENQPVNRVIQLRSQAGQPVTPETEGNETSRAQLANRNTKPVASPPNVDFDEIKVPSALQYNPGLFVSKKSTGQANENSGTPPEEPADSSNWDPAAQAVPQVVQKNEPENDLVTVQKSSSQLVTEIESPKFVNVNQNARFLIKLKNQGTDSIDNVKLVAKLPAHIQLASASPPPSHTDGQFLEFAVSKIEAKGVREISLDLMPTEKEPFEIATQVVIENQQRTSVAVRQPVLSLVLNGPQQTNIGQNVTHELIVTNDGDGTATDVHLDAMFPAQLEQLKQSIGPVIESIESGQSVRVFYQSQALEPGPVQLKVDANAEGVERKQVAMDFNIYQPELRISAVGPKLNYVARDGIYTISLDNTGEVDVTDIQVSLVVPTGMKVTTISRQASVDSEKGILTWVYPKISANATERIQLRATAVNEGVQVCNIQVSSNETPAKEIKLSTQVVTRADLSVRIKNLTGPVHVGGKAEFLVEVENQGSRKASEVNVRIALPESLMAVDKNKVSVEQSENGIEFVEPVVSPGQKVSFKFTAVGVVEGEHVVRSTLEADGSQRQVISEDTVLVYEVAEARVSESLSGEVRR